MSPGSGRNSPGFAVGGLPSPLSPRSCCGWGAPFFPRDPHGVGAGAGRGRQLGPFPLEMCDPHGDPQPCWTFLGCSGLPRPPSSATAQERFKRRLQVNHFPGNMSKMRPFSWKTGEKRPFLCEGPCSFPFYAAFCSQPRGFSPSGLGKACEVPKLWHLVICKKYP